MSKQIINKILCVLFGKRTPKMNAQMMINIEEMRAILLRAGEEKPDV